MLLRKYMSLIGIGSARIDLILQKEHYHPGEDLKGYYLIKGGTVEQQINRIECDLIMTDQTTGVSTVVNSKTILSAKLIQSEETTQIPFSFRLGDEIPYSEPHRLYRFITRLSFNEGVESKDEDMIYIVPKHH